MKKEIMKDGNSHKIRLNAEDMKIEELTVGDLVDIEMVKIRKKKPKLEENNYG